MREETDIYSAEAIRGFNLFMGKAACATCHFPPAFNGTVPPFYAESESEVLGVTSGAGMGLNIENQTLAPDPLNLTKNEVGDLITFLHTLTDTSGLHPGIIDLPKFENQPEWNKRKAVIDY